MKRVVLVFLCVSVLLIGVVAIAPWARAVSSRPALSSRAPAGEPWRPSALSERFLKTECTIALMRPRGDAALQRMIPPAGAYALRWMKPGCS